MRCRLLHLFHTPASSQCLDCIVAVAKHHIANLTHCMLALVIGVRIAAHPNISTNRHLNNPVLRINLLHEHPPNTENVQINIIVLVVIVQLVRSRLFFSLLIIQECSPTMYVLPLG